MGMYVKNSIGGIDCIAASFDALDACLDLAVRLIDYAVEKHPTEFDKRDRGQIQRYSYRDTSKDGRKWIEKCINKPTDASLSCCSVVSRTERLLSC